MSPLDRVRVAFQEIGTRFNLRSEGLFDEPLIERDINEAIDIAHAIEYHAGNAYRDLVQLKKEMVEGQHVTRT